MTVFIRYTASAQKIGLSTQITLQEKNNKTITRKCMINSVSN